MYDRLPPSFRLASLTGFAFSAFFAVSRGWSLQEFAWSTWLAGLCFSWACILSGSLQAALTAGRGKEDYERTLAFLKQVPLTAYVAVRSAAALLAGWLGFQLYSRLFAFYGLFLSVFAEMEPVDLFGRNGFINSDFFTPVTWLTMRFWPMVLGTLLYGVTAFFGDRPWQRMFLPFRSSEILRIHLMTLAIPFLSLLAWAIFRDGYHSVVIVLLMGIFYLLPQKHPSAEEIPHVGTELPDVGSSSAQE